MSTGIHQHNNINGLVCAICKKQLNNCIVRDNLYYCNDGCYTNKVTQVTKVTQSRNHGTCANCRNNYNCKFNSVDEGDKWFCGKTCRQIYNSGHNMRVPATIFPFAATTYTIFPLSVNSQTGKFVF